MKATGGSNCDIFVNFSESKNSTRFFTERYQRNSKRLIALSAAR